jgi:hypothetical protein
MVIVRCADHSIGRNASPTEERLKFSEISINQTLGGYSFSLGLFLDFKAVLICPDAKENTLTHLS